MRRVGIETSDNYDPVVSGAAVFDQVRVALRSGAGLDSAQVRRARGHAELPLREDELFEKFRTCLEVGGSQIAATTLFDRIGRLETIAARELTAIP
jgi:hypothetical protein